MYVQPIAGSASVADQLTANLSRKKDTLKAFTSALDNRPLKDPIHEPYLCLGCDMAGGTTRKAIIGMLSYPLYRTV
ncbi:MAG: hypothetical protein EON60_01245, partial [Alphaproteobacteria bacterium]